MTRDRELLEQLYKAIRKLQRTPSADMPSPFAESEKRGFGPPPTMRDVEAIEAAITIALDRVERHLRETDPKKAPS